MMKILGFRILLGIAAAAAVVATGTAAPPAAPRYPVPVRAWFQPKFLDTRPEVYVGMNLITSLVEADVAERWSGKGVVTLKWAFGPQSEYSQGKTEYYRDQCEPFIDGKPFRFAGVGIDEWNPGSERFAEESKLAAEGYRAARVMWPENLVVAWVTQPDETFLALLADGTFDLAIIEGSTSVDSRSTGSGIVSTRWRRQGSSIGASSALATSRPAPTRPGDG